MCNFLSAVVEFNPAENRIIVHTTPDATHHEKIISYNNLIDTADLLVRVELTDPRAGLSVQNSAPWWTRAIASDVEAQLVKKHADYAQEIANRDYIETEKKRAAEQAESDAIEAVQQETLAAMVAGDPIPQVPEKYRRIQKSAVSNWQWIARRVRGRVKIDADTDPRSPKLLRAYAKYRASLRNTYKYNALLGDGDGWIVVDYEDREWDERSSYQERHGYGASSRRTGYTVEIIRQRHGIARCVKTYHVGDYRKPTAIAAEIDRARKWASQHAMAI